MFLRRTRSFQPFNQKSIEKEETLVEKLRIAAFGYGGVGKTSLIKRFLYDEFRDEYCETIEDDYRQVLEYNDITCDVTILDTAGNHQFPAMRKLAIESCHGFILVYSVDSQKSFEEVKRLYNIIIDIKKTPNVPIILVANKSDTHAREVPNDEAYILINAMGNKCEFIEASAKFNLNTKLVFYDLINFKKKPTLNDRYKKSTLLIAR
ncbi:GTP-binding protein Di-Ras2 [Hydra vulgaris]|uniref:GTP-binding protein Di-Ras2 n=1 Tax=Hydra vulgaris TaxID=6087 RepID=UPI0032E9CF45